MWLSLFLIALCALAARAEDSESNDDTSDSSEKSDASENTLKYTEALLECGMKYDTPPNYLTLIMTGDAPVYENAKCFVKCGMNGLHYLNEDGSLNQEVIRAVVQRYFTDPDAREQAVNAWLTCEKQSQSDQYADDSCDRAFSMFMCYSEEMRKLDANIYE